MKQPRYIKLWARNYSGLLMMSTILAAWRQPSKPAMTVRIGDMLSAPENGLQTCHFSRAGLERQTASFRRQISAPRFRPKQHVRIALSALRRFLKRAKSIERRSRHNLDQPRAKRLFGEYVSAQLELNHFLWLVFWFEVVVEPLIQERLSRSQLDPDVEERLLQMTMTRTVRPLSVTLDRSLMRLALRRLSSTERQQRLKRLTKAYAWIPMYDFADRPLTVSQLRRQLRQHERRSAKEIRQELKQLAVNPAAINRRFKQSISLLKHDRLLQRLIVLAHGYVNLKDLRDDYRRQAYFFLNRFFERFGRAYGAVKNDLVYLTFEEVQRLSPEKFPIARSELAARRRSYLMLMQNGRLSVITGRKIAGTVRRLAEKQSTTVTTFPGQPASPGNVRGRVRIVQKHRDFSRFRSGDILVTTMTHPEFMPIIRQASAIVTDEGGLTCHAAIVARELKIPCIIGTKIATHVLKNDDKIHVDATHGIVKKL